MGNRVLNLSSSVLRRILFALSIAVAAVAIVLAAGVAWGVRRAADPSHLGRTEWMRLRAELAENLATANESAPSESAAPASNGAAGEVERQPATRPARAVLDPALLERQTAEFDARRSKTVVELQRFRHATSMPVRGPGGREAILTLINLDPAVNVWYVLRSQRPDGSETAYHLANARPQQQELELDPSHPEGVMLVDSHRRRPCDLLSDAAVRIVAEAVRARSPYVEFCEESITLRLKTTGNRTAKEWATDFLRDNVWAGEQITVFVRGTLFQDAYISTADSSTSGNRTTPTLEDGPRPGRVDAREGDVLVETSDLGIPTDGTNNGRMVVGQWYPARDNPGIFVSAVQARLVAPEILEGYRALAAPLDEVERGAMVYLVAFDLARFDIGFSVGTDHPRVDWSERISADVREPALPGPDGIGSIEPLVATGVIPAGEAARTAATFTGGFKRSHGAFRSGELSRVNQGSHYGFVENGVVLSKLQPGLSTLFVLVDGRLEMKTWTREDDALLEQVRFARQNGVPIVETDPATGAPRPGALVAQWGLGNWSGSQDKKFRTLRAGACLQQAPGTRYLIYGYFSSATPSAMARVFQAYDCRYAMLLDMNALEHTYLALYRLLDEIGRAHV